MRVFWPGATAQQVAEQVTDKLEKTLQEVPYADKIRSYSKPGEALIIFQVKDIVAAARRCRRSGTRCARRSATCARTLPAGVIGPFFNDEFGDVYGSIYALSADGFTLRGAARSMPTACASACCGCRTSTRSSVFGAQDEKVFVEISQKRLAQLGLDFNQVLAQIGQQNAVESAGVDQLRRPTRAGARGRAVQLGRRAAGCSPIRARRQQRSSWATSPRSAAPMSTRRR